jgi:hypothetical protein
MVHMREGVMYEKFCKRGMTLGLAVSAAAIPA